YHDAARYARYRRGLLNPNPIRQTSSLIRLMQQSRLAIDNPCTRMLISTHFFSELLMNLGIDFLDSVVVNPFMIIVTD
ncbi:MAG TPA: hypothetical protein P5032_03355, partial [Candidatus Competibacter sp.]|nr:hypothetical protein [Candidatus Competibacter sp.]